jgi:hypothetical protein
MATADSATKLAVDKEKLRDEWLARLSELIETVRGWAEELDWSTRRIETKMEDLEIGNYRAPALIIQKETVRAILEPIGRSAPGVEGVVDFYLMPAYDDIASLYFYDGGWYLHYKCHYPPEANTVREAENEPFTREAFQNTLEEMMQNAASSS